MVKKIKTPHQGQLMGGSKTCCGGGCKHQQITTHPGKNQLQIHPLARHALQNLQFDLESLPTRDQTQESGLRAAVYLLENF
jgi:hypothetical protein